MSNPWPDRIDKAECFDRDKPLSVFRTTCPKCNGPADRWRKDDQGIWLLDYCASCIVRKLKAITASTPQE